MRRLDLICFGAFPSYKQLHVFTNAKILMALLYRPQASLRDRRTLLQKRARRRARPHPRKRPHKLLKHQRRNHARPLHGHKVRGPRLHVQARFLAHHARQLSCHGLCAALLPNDHAHVVRRAARQKQDGRVRHVAKPVQVRPHAGARPAIEPRLRLRTALQRHAATCRGVRQGVGDVSVEGARVPRGKHRPGL